MLTGTEAATYSAQARITREQTRAQNKETLLEIIDNESLTQEQKEEAFAAMEHYGYQWVTAVNDYNIFCFPIAKSGKS